MNSVVSRPLSVWQGIWSRGN